MKRVLLAATLLTPVAALGQPVPPPAIPRSGGTMTGPLILNGPPTDPLGAVTKGYADAIAGAAATPGTATPLINGTPSPGSSLLYARQDHVHPTDTSRYAASNPAGYQTAGQVATAIAPYAPLASPVFGQTITVTSPSGPASSVNVGSNTSATSSNLFLNSAAGQYRQVVYATNGINRWVINTGNGAESGGNAGSDFTFSAFDDTGNYLSSPISITRATGQVYMPNLVIGGGSISPRVPTGNAGSPSGAAVLDSSGTANSFIVQGRTELNRVQDIINVMDAPYGAVCDGVTDDAAHINAAFTAAKAAVASHGSAEIQATLRVPRQCVVKSTVNATGISSRGLTVDMTGGQIVGQIPPSVFTGSITSGTLTVSAVTSGTVQVGQYLTSPTAEPLATITALGTGTGGIGNYSVNSTTTIGSETMTGAMPIIDATGSRFLHWTGLNISGDCTAIASVGFVHGVYHSTSVADENTFERPSIQGCYTLSTYLNNASESNVYSQILFRNSYAAGLVGGCYVETWDGINHFGFSSAYLPMVLARDTAYTFTENRTYGGDVRNFGNCTPAWFGGATDSDFSHYIANAGAGSGLGAVLYTAGGAANTKMRFNLHVETSADLATTFQFAGDATQKWSDIIFDDELPEPTLAYMGVASGVTSVTLNDAQIHTPTFLNGASAHLFDPASVSAFQLNAAHVATNTTAAMNLPISQIIGDVWNGSTLTRTGVGTITSVGTGLSLSPSGALAYSLPSPLSVSSIVTTGGVTGITCAPRGDYVSTGGTGFPTITLGAPPLGGTQATAHVQFGSPTGVGTILTAGTGYAAGNQYSLVGGSPTTAAVQTVSTIGGGGSVATIGGVSIGSGYTSILAPPIATQAITGSGSGLTVTGQGFGVSTVVVDAAGSGYTSAPSITFTAATGTSQITAPTCTVALSSSFSAQGGGLGQILLDQTGAKIGSAGVGGSPAIFQGASVDASVVRTTLTGAGYTVPSNTSLVRFVQSGTIASQTITLPTALADGQVLQFVNYAGAITALTFSPSVAGFTNGGGMAINTGLRIRWDATTAAWQREE